MPRWTPCSVPYPLGRMTAEAAARPVTSLGSRGPPSSGSRPGSELAGAYRVMPPGAVGCPISSRLRRPVGIHGRDAARRRDADAPGLGMCGSGREPDSLGRLGTPRPCWTAAGPIALRRSRRRGCSGFDRFGQPHVRAGVRWAARLRRDPQRGHQERADPVDRHVGLDQVRCDALGLRPGQCGMMMILVAGQSAAITRSKKAAAVGKPAENVQILGSRPRRDYCLLSQNKWSKPTPSVADQSTSVGQGSSNARATKPGSVPGRPSPRPSTPRPSRPSGVGRGPPGPSLPPSRPSPRYG